MSKVEEFVDFASKLPSKRLSEVEAILSSIMSSQDRLTQLSSETEAEIQLRLNDLNPEYADNEDVSEILGRHLG